MNTEAFRCISVEDLLASGLARLPTEDEMRGVVSWHSDRIREHIDIQVMRQLYGATPA